MLTKTGQKQEDVEVLSTFHAVAVVSRGPYQTTSVAVVVSRGPYRTTSAAVAVVSRGPYQTTSAAVMVSSTNSSIRQRNAIF